MPTPLLPTFKKRIKDAVDLLVQKQVTPWSFLMTINGLRTKYYNGKEIFYRGVGFEGSPRLVFWSGYIEPYLEELCISEISVAVAMARDREVDVKSLLIEVQSLLIVGIQKVYGRMAEVDRRLRGKGNPQSVGVLSIDQKVQSMKQFLEEHIQAEIAMSKSQPKPMFIFEEWIKKNKFWAWLLAGIIVPVGIAIWLNQPKSNITNVQGDMVGGNKTVIGEQINENSTSAMGDQEANIKIAKLKIERVFQDFDQYFKSITENFGKESQRITEDFSSRGIVSSGIFIQAQEDLSIKIKRELDSKLINLKRSIVDVLVEQLKKPSLDEAGPEFKEYIGQYSEEERKCKNYYMVLNDNPKSWEMSSQNSTRITNSFDVTKY